MDPRKGSDRTYSGLDTPLQPTSLNFCPSGQDLQMVMDHLVSTTSSSNLLNWNPRAMLANLSLLEEKIHQIQDTIQGVLGLESQLSIQPNELAAQQQLLKVDLTCVIIQSILVAGSLLPSMNNPILSADPPIDDNNKNLVSDNHSPQNEAFPLECEENKMLNHSQGDVNEPIKVEDQDGKECDDGFECENLPPGSYEVLQLEKEEILAPHTHFCVICGKGFKRDANLRMHMRGHGDEYKTPEMLAKPAKEPNSVPTLMKRYSCPFVGCKRNKEHKKFQALKTILCVKNHYKRSHCDKSYMCSRCNIKKFSVIADLKTHEKHCGRQKWICSCGTTFSRKDKLFGHVALFQGHAPVLPTDESKALGQPDKVRDSKLMGEGFGFNFGGSSEDLDFLDVKAICDDWTNWSSMNIDSCNFDIFHEFQRPQFEIFDNCLPFMPTTTGNYIQKNEASSSLSNLDRQKL